MWEHVLDLEKSQAQSPASPAQGSRMGGDGKEHNLVRTNASVRRYFEQDGPEV